MHRAVTAIVTRIIELLIVAAVVAGVVTAAPSVRAEEDPRRAARAHYEQGLALANRGAYEAALREFRSAYEKSPQFAVLYNIGQAEIALGHPLEAIEALSRYLRDGGNQVPAERRKQVEAQIALVEALLAELVITSSEPGARVSVDGREVGSTPLSAAVRVTTGPHEISLFFPGAEPVSRNVTLSEGERRALHFDRPAPPPPQEPIAPPATTPARCAEPTPAPRPVPVAEARSGARTTVGYVLVGTGVALGAGAFIHYLWNKGRYDDWSAEQADLTVQRGAPGTAERQAENNELADSIEGASAATVSLFLASTVVLAGGIVLVLTDKPGSDRVGSATNLRLTVSGTRLGLSGAF